MRERIKETWKLWRNKVLNEFVKAGASTETFHYIAKPHIDTFCLVSMVEHMCHEIKSLGGEIHYPFSESCQWPIYRARPGNRRQPGGGRHLGSQLRGNQRHEPYSRAKRSANAGLVGTMSRSPTLLAMWRIRWPASPFSASLKRVPSNSMAAHMEPGATGRRFPGWPAVDTAERRHAVIPARREPHRPGPVPTGIRHHRHARGDPGL